MNADDNKICTPKQTKRLGLRRSSSMLKNSTTATEAPAKHRILENGNSSSTPKSSLCKNDVKVNCKNLEQNHNKNNSNSQTLPCTPENASMSNLQPRLALSTSCRPYRLALSKKVRERMSKKRLEFHLANEVNKAESIEQRTDDEPQHNPKEETSLTTEKDLLSQIEIAQSELKAREEHSKKVEELRQIINIWKSGFVSALHDLQEKIQPRLETEALLDRLCIPQEMIKYIND